MSKSPNGEQMHANPITTTAEAKKRAKAVSERMNDIGVPMKLSHAYEAVAAGAGYRNWATMSASLDAARGTVDDAFNDVERFAVSRGLLVYGLVDPERMADRLTMVSGRPVTTARLIERWREFTEGNRGEANNGWAEGHFEDWLEDHPPF